MNFKKLNKLEIGIFVVISFVIVFFGYNYFQNKEIKQANINGYAFLEQISQCDIIYNIDISSGIATPEFKKECVENAAKNLKDVQFKPGEKGDKFILESEEYLGCSYINNLKGSEAFRNCVRDILSVMRQKYPEIIVKG